MHNKENREHFKKIYKNFSDFIAVAAGSELEYFILDSKFTTEFNVKIKEVFRELRSEGKEEIELSVLFNTEGEIVVIDANILGKFLANKYTIVLEEYYKDATLNKVIRSIINGSEKSQKDFIAISYSIFYRTLNELYKEIKCKKEVINHCKDRYKLKGYEGNDISIVIISLLIIEDMCKYIGVKGELLKQQIQLQILKEKNSH